VGVEPTPERNVFQQIVENLIMYTYPEIQ